MCLSLSRYESLHDLYQQTFSDFSHLFGHHKLLLTCFSSIPYYRYSANDMGPDGTRSLSKLINPAAVIIYYYMILPCRKHP